MQHPTIVPLLDNDFLGQYRVSMLTGTMGAGIAAASSICHLRNATAGRLLLFHEIGIAYASLGTGFTQGTAIFGLIMGRGVTEASASGAAVDLSPDNALDATFPTSLSDGLFRIATTAAMTAGAGETLDNNALIRKFVNTTTAVDTVMTGHTALLEAQVDRDYPIVVRNGEVLHINATVPATGTWQAVISVRWSEVTMVGRTGAAGV